MINQNFIAEFSQVIEIPQHMLTDNFHLTRDAAWDSLAFISTIALIDKYYNKVIDGDVLSSINTFGELKSLVDRSLN